MPSSNLIGLGISTNFSPTNSSYQLTSNHNPMLPLPLFGMLLLDRLLKEIAVYTESPRPRCFVPAKLNESQALPHVSDPITVSKGEYELLLGAWYSFAREMAGMAMFTNSRTLGWGGVAEEIVLVDRYFGFFGKTLYYDLPAFIKVSCVCVRVCVCKDMTCGKRGRCLRVTSSEILYFRSSVLIEASIFACDIHCL